MQAPMSALLKKHILGVYLSALIYNKSATLLYFEHNDITAQLLAELVSTQKKMKHNYERRLFIVGLSELLQNEVLPESLRPQLIGMIDAVIDSLMSMIKEEEKEAKRKAKAEMQQSDESEDEGDDIDSESDDSDDENLQDDFGNESDDGVNAQRAIGDDELGFVNREERKGADSDDENVYGSENEATEDSMVSVAFESHTNFSSI